MNYLKDIVFKNEGVLGMISCREMINLGSLSKLKIVAGKSGLDRVVRWVHFLDLPDVIPWVQGGELLIITGIGLNGETQKLTEMILGIIKKNLAGLIINVGPYIKEVPPEVIKVAEEANFPVFELPWEVKLIKVTQEICSYIVMKQTEARSINDFLEQLLLRPLEDSEGLIQRAAYYGYDLSKTYQVAIINPIRLAEFVQDQKVKEEKTLANLKVRFEEVVREVLAIADRKILTMVWMDNLILLMPYERKDTMSRQNIGILVQIVEKLAAKLPGLTVTAGLGGRFEKLHGARQSYIEANRVLHVATLKTSFSCPVSAYEQLGIYKLLFEIEPKKLTTYHQDVIEPLTDYDHKHHMDLVASLFVYFEENGNAAKAAKRLFVHRNTFDYRMKKIEEITGKDLNDPYDRLTLQLGVIIGKQLAAVMLSEELL